MSQLFKSGTYDRNGVPFAALLNENKQDARESSKTPNMHGDKATVVQNKTGLTGAPNESTLQILSKEPPSLGLNNGINSTKANNSGMPDGTNTGLLITESNMQQKKKLRGSTKKRFNKFVNQGIPHEKARSLCKLPWYIRDKMLLNNTHNMSSVNHSEQLQVPENKNSKVSPGIQEQTPVRVSSNEPNFQRDKTTVAHKFQNGPGIPKAPTQSSPQTHSKEALSMGKNSTEARDCDTINTNIEMSKTAIITANEADTTNTESSFNWKKLSRTARKKYHRLKEEGIPQDEARRLCRMPLSSLNEILLNHLRKRKNSEDQGPASKNPKISHTDGLNFDVPLRVGITNSKPMSEDQMKMLHQHLILAIKEKCSKGEGPQFMGFSHKAGWVLVTCDNQRSKEWLVHEIPYQEPWPEARLSIIPDEELPKPPTAVTFIPEADAPSVKEALSILKMQNFSLNTELWKVRYEKVENQGRTLSFTLDDPSADVLRAQNCQAVFGLKMVSFKIRGQYRSYNPKGTQNQVLANSNQGVMPGSFNPQVSQSVGGTSSHHATLTSKDGPSTARSQLPQATGSVIQPTERQDSQPSLEKTPFAKGSGGIPWEDSATLVVRRSVPQTRDFSYGIYTSSHHATLTSKDGPSAARCQLPQATSRVIQPTERQDSQPSPEKTPFAQGSGGLTREDPATLAVRRSVPQTRDFSNGIYTSSHHATLTSKDGPSAARSQLPQAKSRVIQPTERQDSQPSPEKAPFAQGSGGIPWEDPATLAVRRSVPQTRDFSYGIYTSSHHATLTSEDGPSAARSQLPQATSRVIQPTERQDSQPSPEKTPFAQGSGGLTREDPATLAVRRSVPQTRDFSYGIYTSSHHATLTSKDGPSAARSQLPKATSRVIQPTERQDSQPSPETTPFAQGSGGIPWEDPATLAVRRSVPQTRDFSYGIYTSSHHATLTSKDGPSAARRQLPQATGSAIQPTHDSQPLPKKTPFAQGSGEIPWEDPATLAVGRSVPQTRDFGSLPIIQNFSYGTFQKYQGVPVIGESLTSTRATSQVGRSVVQPIQNSEIEIPFIQGNGSPGIIYDSDGSVLAMRRSSQRDPPSHNGPSFSHGKTSTINQNTYSTQDPGGMYQTRNNSLNHSGSTFSFNKGGITTEQGLQAKGFGARPNEYILRGTIPLTQTSRELTESSQAGFPPLARGLSQTGNPLSVERTSTLNEMNPPRVGRTLVQNGMEAATVFAQNNFIEPSQARCGFGDRPIIMNSQSGIIFSQEKHGEATTSDYGSAFTNQEPSQFKVPIPIIQEPQRVAFDQGNVVDLTVNDSYERDSESEGGYHTWVIEGPETYGTRTQNISGTGTLESAQGPSLASYRHLSHDHVGYGSRTVSPDITSDELPPRSVYGARINESQSSSFLDGRTVNEQEKSRMFPPSGGFERIELENHGRFQGSGIDRESMSVRTYEGFGAGLQNPQDKRSFEGRRTLADGESRPRELLSNPGRFQSLGIETESHRPFQSSTTVTIRESRSHNGLLLHTSDGESPTIESISHGRLFHRNRLSDTDSRVLPPRVSDYETPDLHERLFRGKLNYRESSNRSPHARCGYDAWNIEESEGYRRTPDWN